MVTRKLNPVRNMNTAPMVPMSVGGDPREHSMSIILEEATAELGDPIDPLGPEPSPKKDGPV